MVCSSLVEFVCLRSAEQSLGGRERDAREHCGAVQGPDLTPRLGRPTQADISPRSSSPLRHRACGTGRHLLGAKSDRSPETRHDPSRPIGAVASSPPSPPPSLAVSAKPTPLRYQASVPTRHRWPSQAPRSAAVGPDPGERPIAHKFHIRAVSDSLTSTGTRVMLEGRLASARASARLFQLDRYSSSKTVS